MAKETASAEPLSELFQIRLQRTMKREMKEEAAEKSAATGMNITISDVIRSAWLEHKQKKRPLRK